MSPVRQIKQGLPHDTRERHFTTCEAVPCLVTMSIYAPPVDLSASLEFLVHLLIMIEEAFVQLYPQTRIKTTCGRSDRVHR